MIEEERLKYVSEVLGLDSWIDGSALSKTEEAGGETCTTEEHTMGSFGGYPEFIVTAGYQGRNST